MLLRCSFALILLDALIIPVLGQLPRTPIYYHANKFVMGADLSYINEIEDFGGAYFDNLQKKDPFVIFKDHGCNTVRVRLWHQPDWIKPLTGGKLYSDLEDATKTIRRAKNVGMVVNLDIHYSDDWADPNKQPTPEAWAHLDFETLKDTVYRYTRTVLNYLKERNLVPEMIQVGNETNFGMLWPAGKIVNDSNWNKFGELLNSGIKAVRDFSAGSVIKPQIILHVAQLQNADEWTRNIITKGKVTDFDILGLSHYYKWSTVNTMEETGKIIRQLKNTYHKKIMIVETAFPWTMDNADSYNNIFGGLTEISGFPVSVKGQFDYLKALTQQIISSGGDGIMYWEPAWITSPMKDRWGKGSAWENNCYFDFKGNLLPSIDFMTWPYAFPKK